MIAGQGMFPREQRDSTYSYVLAWNVSSDLEDNDNICALSIVKDEHVHIVNTQIIIIVIIIIGAYLIN